MLKITKNGRTIQSNRLADEIMKDVRGQATDSIRQDFEKKLRGFRCPEHGTGATVTVAIDGAFKQGKVTVKTCCDKADEEVRRILN
ncbi:hypothetical protein [Polyangium spumosum]|uniref:Uncharacterized protein n=1 Tax=Polyangium spumosum TaxID=889282 RepID=A0A6N7PSJ7_9BACT|nr:hypothetical protein [Polyangium spumosum]MRG94627.1 hypothetical protein [Polyangium spumosum]